MRLPLPAALEAIHALARAMQATQESAEKKGLLRMAQRVMDALTNATGSGFALLEEDGLDVRLELDQADSPLQEALDVQVDKGTFGWALAQNRAVLLEEEGGNTKILVQALGGQQGVIGAYVALVSSEPTPTAERLVSLTAILASTALETNELRSSSHRRNSIAELR